MLFLFTLHLYFDQYLNPRFDAGLDRPFIAQARSESPGKTQVLDYRYTSDGKEIAYSYAPEGGAYHIKVTTRPDGFFETVAIHADREGAIPGGDWTRFRFRYRNDTLIDSIAVTRNDTLVEHRAYHYDAKSRVDTLWTLKRSSDTAAWKRSSIIFSYFDSAAHDFRTSDGRTPGTNCLFVHESKGRFVERRCQSGTGDRSDWKLLYNEAGVWAGLQQFFNDSLQVTHSFTYRPLNQVLGLADREGNGRSPQRTGSLHRPWIPSWLGRNALGRRGS